ncbi:MAG: hypothetical protein QM765_19645 [Myxococcales bacterium]
MNELLSLAHVHRVTTHLGERTVDLFVFDHHRSAFPLWARFAAERGPLTLVTLDRHMDLERPASPPPAYASPLEELDAYARWKLSPRNDDHVLAALDCGALTDAVVLARSHAPTGLAGLHLYKDAGGRSHRVEVARTVEDAGPEALALVRSAGRIALDVDLDCFTTLSDAHLDEVVTWDAEHIDAFLRPPGSEDLWRQVLAKVCVVTIAREPYHCGGLERGARLWGEFSRVFFGRLLGVPAP